MTAVAYLAGECRSNRYHLLCPITSRSMAGVEMRCICACHVTEEADTGAPDTAGAA